MGEDMMPNKLSDAAWEETLHRPHDNERIQHHFDATSDGDVVPPSAQDHLINSHAQIGPSGESEFDSHEELPIPAELADGHQPETEPHLLCDGFPKESVADPERDRNSGTTERQTWAAVAETIDEDEPSRRESALSDVERRHSLRTEALIQAAARAVVALREGPDNGDESDQQPRADAHEPAMGSRSHDSHNPSSRPRSSTSRSAHSSDAYGVEGNSPHGTEDDVFSDHSPQSSLNSDNGNCGEEAVTEKGGMSSYTRSRVASGLSLSGTSEISDLSRLSRYEKEIFILTSRTNRPALRSPSSFRVPQISSPTPSIHSSPSRFSNRTNDPPATSRLGRPPVTSQYSHSPQGQSKPSRLKRPEPAPLVLLHVTLLPLRWVYGNVVNHFETKKIAPMSFSSEGLKSLRLAWRQLRDRLGDTEMERGILLPHPQNDYEVLEERLLEALELPLRRRARILECGHYLGPSNELALNDDVDHVPDDLSDSDGLEASTAKENRHWCKTCKSDIKYQHLGSGRVFRIKVYASNGLMSAGAWEACWKEMERVDIQVEPIIDSSIQQEMAKLAAICDREQQRQLAQQTEQEQRRQLEEEQRLRMQEEQTLQLEEERRQLDAQRRQFEDHRRQSMEEAHKTIEEQRRKVEEEHRVLLEEERRQNFEVERQLLEAQGQEFEEQRQVLEEQRKMIEYEQRQHLEEARRLELEADHRIIDEQKAQLETAQEQLEADRQHHLEEEELRRLRRKLYEQKGLSSARSPSPTSFAVDELPPLIPKPLPSTDVGGRHRDSASLREMYGNNSRASSEAMTTSRPSPSIHTLVDSGRQPEEEQDSRQLATIPISQDSVLHADQLHFDARHTQFPIPTNFQPPTSKQTCHRPENRRRSLEAASFAELLGETIRVLLQDPKNVAIAVLAVLIAILAGHFVKREEGSLEFYRPQHHQYQQHHIEDREVMVRARMNKNTPVSQPTEATSSSTPSQRKEIVYKTVTESWMPPPVIETVYKTVTEAFQQVPSSQRAETAYRNAVEFPVEDPPAIAVETIYSSVTETLPKASDPYTIGESELVATTEVASESLPSSASPVIVDSMPLSLATMEGETNGLKLLSSPVVGTAFEALPPPPSSQPETERESSYSEQGLEMFSNASATKITHQVEYINTAIFNPTCKLDVIQSASAELPRGQ